ncbi:hypothetical protein F5Y17DRAFT_24002 [Xylariaceae sp. FL0594]|nr:hypothetical protein F5Y17DRAFT_24002 [Xylariaceae sp. FL0594]
MDSSTAYFPQFSRLPPELREQIWAYAFPEARVYEVRDVFPRHPSPSPSSGLMFADSRNEPLPALSRVCWDARHAVLRHYKPLVFSGVVKHVNLKRDVLLLDSYLQVRRLLKVVRLLSQMECVRRSASRIALGTSWGVHTGLHLRLFHKTVRTKQTMARLLSYLSRFSNLESLILVVWQQTAFNLSSAEIVFPTGQHGHFDLWRGNHIHLNVSFDMVDPQYRRPYETRLVRYDPEAQKTEKESTFGLRNKFCYRYPGPSGSQVRDLITTFEKSMRGAAGDEKTFRAGPIEPPKLETATLTWLYHGSILSNQTGIPSLMDATVTPIRY